MKHSLSRLLGTASLSLLMATSSLWASNFISKDEETPTSYSQTTSQVPLSKEERKAHLLAQKVDQYPTINCDENNLDHKVYIPKDIMLLIVDHMEPQVFGNFLAISQSSFELSRSYLLSGRRAFTKVISSQAGIEAYRKSCLLGTLPHISFNYYDGKGLPEEAKTALHSLAMKNRILLNKDVTFLSYLTNLRTLNVAMNYLSKHVTVLTGLTNLHTLEVEYNNLGEHVTALTGLTNLYTLNMWYNLLGEHITALTGLTNFHTLYVASNDLGEHVTALTGFINLHALYVEDNQLNKHITALTVLTNLHTLSVGSNNLGEHVTALTSLTNLHALYVQDNQLSKHITALTGLSNLSALNVSFNNLGEHVTAFENLTSIKSINY